MREKNKVIYRQYSSGEVVALFPEIPASGVGVYCLSFHHVGQHGAADYDYVIRHTKPGTESGWRDLHKELEDRGYRPKVYVRRSPRMCAQFEAAVKAMGL